LAPRRQELEDICAWEAPLASARASLARARDARSASRSTASDCAEARLSIEDLSARKETAEVAELSDQYAALCE
jgi:hypothetical protein